MTNDTAALKARVDQMARLLAAHGITDQATARTSPVKRVLFEQTYSGPNRHHAAALKALTGAGFDAATAAPHHDGSGGDSWLTVTSTWDHDGLPDSGYQTDRMAAAGRTLEPYGYTLRTHGVVGGWGQPA